MRTEGTAVLGLLEARRAELHEAAARHGGIRLWVFGSVARGQERPDSDIDLVVQFQPGRSLFDLMDLEAELSELLDRPVDVISLGGLKDRDEQIRRDMRPL